MQNTIICTGSGWGRFESTDTENVAFNMPFKNSANVPVDILNAVITSHTENLPLEIYFDGGIKGEWSVIAYDSYTIATTEGPSRSGRLRYSLRTDKDALSRQLVLDIQENLNIWSDFYGDKKRTEAELTVLLEKIRELG